MRTLYQSTGWPRSVRQAGHGRESLTLAVVSNGRSGVRVSSLVTWIVVVLLRRRRTPVPRRTGRFSFWSSRMSVVHSIPAFFRPATPRVNAVSHARHALCRNSRSQPIPGPEYERAPRSFLSLKYRDKPIGVISMGRRPRLSAEMAREPLARRPRRLRLRRRDGAAGGLPSNVTGKTTRLRLEDMVSAARAVVPDLRRIAVVGDRLDRQTAFAHFHDALPTMAAALEIIDLTGLPMMELRRSVAALPDRRPFCTPRSIRTATEPTFLPRRLSR